MAENSPDGNPELRLLLWSQLAGELDPEKAAKLESLLLGDPAALSEYVAYTRMLIDMRSLEATEPAYSLPTGNPPVGPPPAVAESPGGILRFLSVVWVAVQTSPRLVVMTLGGALTAYFVVMLALIPLTRSLQRAAGPVRERSAASGTELASGTDIGSLVSGGQARWTQKPSAPGASGVRIGDHYQLAAGMASIVLVRGARVTVEGPAVWHFVSDQQLQLDSGRIVAQVPQAAIGFTVVTPEATIVDLGTEFGVDVDNKGATDVHVFRGQVELRRSQSKGVAAADPAKPTRVAAGESRHVDAKGNISIVRSGGAASRFQRNLPPDEQDGDSLDLVDLLAGGNGNGHRRNVSIDPRNGRCGDLEVIITVTDDKAYRLTPQHAAMDGCFIPNGSTQVDSAGHRFNFPRTEGDSCYHFWAGQRINWLDFPQRIGTTDYAEDGHVFVLLNPNKGLSLDLLAIRRMNRGKALKAFNAVGGNSIPAAHLASARPGLPPPKADFFVLVDGQLRYQRAGLIPDDGPFPIEVSLVDGDRFLTIAATDGGDSLWGDWVILGDPQFLLRP